MADTQWHVGQDVIIRTRRMGDSSARVTRIGRKYVYAVANSSHSRERRFYIDTGREVSDYGYAATLGTPEMFAQRDADQRLKDRVRRAGWAPRSYGDPPIEEWRAIAAALAVEEEETDD